MIEKSKKEISHHIAHVSKSKAGKKMWPGSYLLVLKSLSSSFRPDMGNCVGVLGQDTHDNKWLPVKNKVE